MAEAAIEFNSVDYTYHANTSFAIPGIQNVSFTIPQGSFTAIIGQTGSGKSTLVNLIAGLSKPTNGTVRVVNHLLDSQSKKAQQAAIQGIVGFVFQFPEQQLFANTVWNDVAFGPRNLGWSAEKINQRVQHVLEQVKFPVDLYQQSPLELSGGQQRLAAIAGVLVMDPQILILDEPTAGLDSATSHRLLSLLDHLHQTGVTIIMITHHLEYIANRADQIMLMGAGQLQFMGSAQELFSSPELLEHNHILPPATVQIAKQLLPTGRPLPLSVSELADQLSTELKAGGQHE